MPHWSVLGKELLVCIKRFHRLRSVKVTWCCKVFESVWIQLCTTFSTRLAWSFINHASISTSRQVLKQWHVLLLLLAVKVRKETIESFRCKEGHFYRITRKIPCLVKRNELPHSATVRSCVTRCERTSEREEILYMNDFAWLKMQRQHRLTRPWLRLEKISVSKLRFFTVKDKIESNGSVKFALDVLQSLIRFCSIISQK